MANFSSGAKKILEQRYLKKDKEGKVIESPDEMLDRVATHIVGAEKEESRGKWKKKYLEILDSLEFLPNSPTFMNAGKELGQLSACLSGDTVVRTCAGDFTIKDLAEKYLNTPDERFDVYCITSFSKIGIGKAFNPRLTKKNAPVFKVSFDDGSFVKATEDHLFMFRNGKFGRVDQLKIGQSMMPYNYDYNNGYLILFEGIERYPIAAHKLVYNTLSGNKLLVNEVIHHKNYNKLDNSYDNLQKMDKIEHVKWHSQHLKEFNPMFKVEACLKISEYMKSNNPMKNKQTSYKVGIKNKISLLGNKNARTVSREKRTCELCNTEFICKSTSIKRFCSKKCSARNNSPYVKNPPVGELNSNFGSGKFLGIPWWLQSDTVKEKVKQKLSLPRKSLHNHKIVSIEFCGYEDVYDMSVEKYHNFAANNIFVHNCFVLPVEDNLSAIFEVVKQSALIHKTGGGTGFSFSRIRPKGSIVGSTKGVASGPVSFMYAFDAVTETVKQGGVRRGANLGLLNVTHPDIKEFAECKKNNDKLQNFNISVGMTGEFLNRVKTGKPHILINPVDKTDRSEIDAKELFDLMCDNVWNNGDPGFVFLDTINNANPIPWMGRIETTNPCITGDTLIATADGRNAVSIKQLVLEGKDVPVYCADENGKIHIRYGRNPRLTGVNKPIYKILLDDGSFIKATDNHQFILRNGVKKEVKDLQAGDSLLRFDRFKYEGRCNQFYWGIRNTARGLYAEHRLIKEFDSNKYLATKEVIHHKDYNGLNNLLDNLLCVSEDEHNKIHSIDKLGNNNPMIRFPEKNWMNNPEKQLASRIKNHIGAKRSDETKRRIGLTTVEHFKDEAFRTKHSNAVKQAMENNDNFNKGIENRARLKLQDCQSKTDLECYLVGNSVYVKKTCEGCGVEFGVIWNKREVAFHNLDCWNANQSKVRQKRKVYANHKVVSVEPCGYEDVYNLTVDDFHNYATITSVDNSLMSGIIISNCGEQPLLAWESCNLGSIDVSKFINDGEINWNRLEKVVCTAVRFLDDVIDINEYPRVKIARKTKITRKVGLGIMGWADLLLGLNIRYDSAEALELAEKLMSTIKNWARKYSEELGKEKGFFPAFRDNLKRRNSTLTTIAPTGTLSMLAGCSSGIEPIFAREFSKTVLGNVKIDLSSNNKNSKALVTALEISPENHIRVQAAFQKHTDNAVSKTVNLPYDSKVDEIKKSVFLAYELGCKGLTFFRYGSREAPVEITTEGLSECEGGKCTL